MIATSLRTFLLDGSSFDYGMPMLHEALKQCEAVDEITPLADLLYMLMEFKQTTHKGVDHYADYRAKHQMKLEQQMNVIREEAREAYHNYIEGNVNARMVFFDLSLRMIVLLRQSAAASR